jgi:response regulator RpfG family c-di-GMP phosphodiesterase
MRYVAYMRELILNGNSCPTLRSARSRVLRRVGYQVIEAAGDAEILRMAQASKPDLIVINGPSAGTDRDVCGLIRVNPATKNIALISICSTRVAEYRVHDRSVDLRLPDTVTPRMLVSAIRLVLRTKSAERERAFPKTSSDQPETYDLMRLKEQLEVRVEELRRQNDALIQTNKDLRAAAPVAAHDLLSPLCTISSLTSWIFGEYCDQLGAGGQEWLGLLQQSVERMRIVVEMFLTTTSDGRVCLETVADRPGSRLAGRSRL